MEALCEESFVCVVVKNGLLCFLIDYFETFQKKLKQNNKLTCLNCLFIYLCLFAKYCNRGRTLHSRIIVSKPIPTL